MVDKIATAEEVQNEIKAIWAMTEEAEPSREKIAKAIAELSEKVSADPPTFDKATYEKALSESATEIQKAVTSLDIVGDALDTIIKLATGVPKQPFTEWKWLSDGCDRLDEFVGKAIKEASSIKKAVKMLQERLNRQ